MTDSYIQDKPQPSIMPAPRVPTPTPRGDHLRVDVNNPYAGDRATAPGFRREDMEANEAIAKKLREDAVADAEEKDERERDREPGQEPEQDDRAEQVEAVATKLREDAQAEADARVEARAEDWPEGVEPGGPFDPASMATNNEVAENLIEDAQESADEKDEAAGGGTEPPDPPLPGDNTGTITSFTAGNPTAVVMDAQDLGMIEVGGTITLEALEGEPAAKLAIDGQTVAVLSIESSNATLDLDLSAADVTGLTADFVINGVSRSREEPGS